MSKTARKINYINIISGSRHADTATQEAARLISINIDENQCTCRSDPIRK